MRKSILQALTALSLCTVCLPLLAQSGIVEERVSNEDGFIQTCGEGAGLSPCRDINGETYDEEVRGPSINQESTDELAAEAAHIRNESPAELEKTIGELEQGINPDDRATEGLPH
jgi:hypothetical protein